MKNEFIPKKLKHETEEYSDHADFFLSLDDTDDFRTGWCGEKDKTYVCKICGSKRFIVGGGDYRTLVKCEKCEYEIIIHAG